MINCKNCGAPLKNGKCEYCGSEFEFVTELNSFQQVITIRIGDSVRKFYIRSIESEPVTLDYCVLGEISSRTIIARDPHITLTLESLN